VTVAKTIKNLLQSILLVQEQLKDLKLLIAEQFLKVNGKMNRETVMVNKSGQMVQGMKGIG